MSRPGDALVSAWLLASALAAAHAGEPAEAQPPSVSHRLSLRTGLFSGTRSVDDRHGVGELSVWSAGTVQHELGRLVWNASAQEQSRHDEVPAARVRELSLRCALGPLEIRAGRLMPAWGRADGWNPTDNLAPRDFRLLAPEAEDLRFGRDGLQVDWPLAAEAGRLSGFVFPRAASHRLAWPARPGVRTVVESPPRRGDWALKWDRSGAGWDASLSYVHGHDLMPDLRLVAVDARGALLALANHRSRVLGADLSWQSGTLVWRAETALSHPEPSDAQAFERKRPAWWLVGGPEWSSSAWTVGGQGVWQAVSAFQDAGRIDDPLQREAALTQASLANQTAPRQLGLSLRVAHRALDDTLQTEVSGLGLWPLGSGRAGTSPHGLLRGKLDYAINDAWALGFGVEWPFGPARSFFGLWKDNRLAHLQLRRSL